MKENKVILGLVFCALFLVIPAFSFGDITPVATPTVAVPQPAAPPAWAQEIMVSAEKLPIVGPVVSKVLLWSGIVAGILTTLVAALLSIVNTLMGVANLSGLNTVATALAKFRDGKIMYWLKFFSLFNAKKPEGATQTTMVNS